MSQRIADEIENRRGLVLGLTLAEVLSLLLFLLLLALGAQITALKDEAETEKERAKEIEISKAELAAENAALKSISADSMKIQEFRDAINAATEIDPADPPATLRRAVEVLKQLGSNTTPEQIKSLSEMTADAAHKIETLERERDKYRRQIDNLVRSGNGLTFPSCWTAPDGRAEYMFDITIRDQGLIVSDPTPGRANDPQMKLLQPFQRGVVIDERLFKTATNKVFDWSKGERCRFYAIIRDGTGPASKQRYKELRKVIEDRFYPLHLLLSSASSRHEQQSPDQQTSGVPMGGPYVSVPPESHSNC